MEGRTVYILLTRSGTWFSRLIHLATQDQYTHASIGLDGPSGPFYSFARKFEHFALPAGLVVFTRRGAYGCESLVRERRTVQKLLPEAVCDAARLDDIMRFYSGRDAQ